MQRTSVLRLTAVVEPRLPRAVLLEERIARVLRHAGDGRRQGGVWKQSESGVSHGTQGVARRPVTRGTGQGGRRHRCGDREADEDHFRPCRSWPADARDRSLGQNLHTGYLGTVPGCVGTTRVCTAVGTQYSCNPPVSSMPPRGSTQCYGWRSPRFCTRVDSTRSTVAQARVLLLVLILAQVLILVPVLVTARVTVLVRIQAQFRVPLRAPTQVRLQFLVQHQAPVQVPRAHEVGLIYDEGVPPPRQPDLARDGPRGTS